MGYKVAVLGATGNVGREILKILEERDFPLDAVYALASSKAPGREVSFGEEGILSVHNGEDFDFSTVDFVLASPGAAASRKYAPRVVEAGAIYIDNSSAFRMEPGVPLVVPEVNQDQLKNPKKGIIASPNCIAIPVTVALKPLHGKATVRRVVLSTYQSVSGAGRACMNELMDQTRSTLMNAVPKVEQFPKQIAFNILPHIDVFDQDGHTGEETKIIQETRKILDPDIKVAVTSVRVPTFVGHGISATVEFDREISPQEARKLLSKAPGVEVFDQTAEDHYITPLDCVAEDAVFVSRIRKDPSRENSLQMWIVSDNLRKGAALNTVQILEALVGVEPVG